MSVPKIIRSRDNAGHRFEVSNSPFGFAITFYQFVAILLAFFVGGLLPEKGKPLQ